jgi:hypothetical protein
MEIKSDYAIPFLVVLAVRNRTALASKVYRKSTNAGRYINFKSNPLHVRKEE